MYDPSIGRWLSEDPLGFEAGDSNLYRYVGNGPTNATDPSGLRLIVVEYRGVGGVNTPQGRFIADVPLVIGPFETFGFVEPMAMAFRRCCPRNRNRIYSKPFEETRISPETCLSPNTVLKWSRSLQAAFERGNRFAGRKCIRSVVPEGKLLTSNPWNQFTWIDGLERPQRRFNGEELLSLIEHLETSWSAVVVGGLAAKVFLWSGCRKSEISGLTWKMERIVGREVHFQIEGKHGVRRWFRIPEGVHRELLAARTESPFVFAAYSGQIQQVHHDRPGTLKMIRREFDPENFADWFYRRVKEWSEGSPNGRAYVHHFRKTTLQQARRGEDINR